MYANMLTKFMQNGCEPHVFLVKNTAINTAYEKCSKDRIIKMLSKLLETLVHGKGTDNKCCQCWQMELYYMQQ